MLTKDTVVRMLLAGVAALALLALPEALGADVGLTVVDPLKPIYSVADVEASSTPQVLRLVAPANGFASAQVVATGTGLSDVSVEITPLEGPSGTIPSDRLRIRYADKEEGFNLKEMVQGREADELDQHRFLDAYYDRLLDSPPEDAADLLPIWLTVTVPSDTPAGTYEGKLSAGGESVPVELMVGGWKCPEPDEWTTHVGTPASTDALAKQYELEPWSEEHWKLIEEQLKLLGGIGSDDLWIYVSPSYQIEGLATVRFRSTDEGLVPDFSLLDRYLELYKRHAGRPQWVIVHLWNGRPSIRRRRISTTQPGIVDGEPGDIPRPNTPEGRPLWKRVMDGVHKRVTDLGWSEECILTGLSKDQTPTQWTVDLFHEVAPYSRWASWSHGRGGLSLWAFEPDEPIRYASGQVLAWYAHPYTPRPADWLRRPGGVQYGVVPVPIQGGWNAVRNNYASCRNDLHKYHIPSQYRSLPNGTMLTVDQERGGNAGFAFVWFDFWQRHFPNGWMRGGTRRNTGSIVEPGPEGPIGTVRYEMLREGLQETEARVVIEKALVKDSLDETLASDCRALLERMIDIRFKKGPQREDQRDPFAFEGGHAGSTFGRPAHTWGAADYPEWMALTARLFELASKVQQAEQH